MNIQGNLETANENLHTGIQGLCVSCQLLLPHLSQVRDQPDTITLVAPEVDDAVCGFCSDDKFGYLFSVDKEGEFPLWCHHQG